MSHAILDDLTHFSPHFDHPLDPRIDQFAEFRHTPAHPQSDPSFDITSPPHNLGIIHTSTQFWQATMGFSSSLATKP
jgi:hypothetical protein